MWECQFSCQKTYDRELQQFLVVNATTSPLDPRDAFYGGRTNCTRLHHKTAEGDKIRYLDVCSLYPWACKYGKFPIRHATPLVDDRCPQTLDGVEGIVKATVLPPPNLYHPVLPVRVHAKLFFPLCKTCVENINQEDCNHSPEQRQISGTWVSDELKLALTKGYKIIRIHEVWQYDTKSFGDGDDGLFTGYINQFLKLKQESSGWPDWCVTEEAKERYIGLFQQKEGVLLDKQKISKNKGFRALAKLMLNSFWGKFGQRNNLSQTTFVRSRQELTDVLTRPGVEVENILPINEDVILTNWKCEDDAITPSHQTSVVIAAYVTAIARIKLYSYLDMLGERVLYFDTDSIVFTEGPHDISPDTGDFLGDLTDEITSEYGSDAYIAEFVSGGPKNYAFHVELGGGKGFRTVCKVKGINLHFQNAGAVNFDVMKKMVLEGVTSSIHLPRGKKIFRDKSFGVFSGPEKKSYRVVYTKRRRIDNFNTLPFGYKRVLC